MIFAVTNEAKMRQNGRAYKLQYRASHRDDSRRLLVTD